MLDLKIQDDFLENGPAISGNELQVPGVFFYHGNAGLSSLIDPFNNATLLHVEDWHGGSPTIDELITMDDSDIFITGDYDGGGKDDIRYWRSNSEGQGNRFIVFLSESNYQDTDEFLIPGSLGTDIPIANSRMR